MLRNLALIAVLAACAPASRAPDFQLTDDVGSSWQLADQAGTPVALTFGFTRCRDICPATVAKLLRVARSMPQSRRPEIVFVSVDPSRDTPVVLHRFLGRFAAPGDRIVGLTGSPARVQSVQEAYHVSAPASALGRRLPGGDVDHATAIFLIDANGRLAGLADGSDSLQTLNREMAAVAR